MKPFRSHTTHTLLRWLAGALLLGGGVAGLPVAWTPPIAGAAPTARRAASPGQTPARRAAPSDRSPARGKAPATRTQTSTARSTAPTARTTPSTTHSDTSPRAIFDEANRRYHKGDYRGAARRFQQLLKSDGWANFPIYYNLGNTYMRLQQYGRALAYYRKAQQLRPNHLDLLHNIQLLFRRLGKSDAQSDGLRIKFLFWYYLLNLKQLFFVAVGFTWLVLLLWAAHIRRSTRGHHGLRWPFAALATFAVIVWFSLGVKLYQERYLTTGVIVQPRVTARSGYGDQFEPLFQLNEADEVVVRKRLQVKTPDGLQQWLQVEATLVSKDGKTRTRKTGWLPARSLQTI